MTYAAADQAAIDLISVHGAEAMTVVRECIAALLRCADAEAVASWLAIFEAVRSRLI